MINDDQVITSPRAAKLIVYACFLIAGQTFALICGGKVREVAFKPNHEKVRLEKRRIVNNKIDFQVACPKIDRVVVGWLV